MNARKMDESCREMEYLGSVERELDLALAVALGSGDLGRDGVGWLTHAVVVAPVHGTGVVRGVLGLGLVAVVRGAVVHLEVENGRKNVKSAPNRPISSAYRRRQRLAHAYAHVNPAQYGQKGENWSGKRRTRVTNATTE